MSSSRGAGGSVEVRLVGYVTLQDVCSHVGDIWRAARQQQGLLFAVDCAAVIDFSSLALTALARLRKHLREFGCDMQLQKCSPSVLERRDDPLLTDLMTAQPMPEKSEKTVEPVVPEKPRNRVFQKAVPQVSSPRRDPEQSSPVPHHLRPMVRDFQRYWLN